MKRKWKDIKWIFKPDGGLLDLYVQEVSINDWEVLIDLINEKHEVNFGHRGEAQNSQNIDKNYVLEYLLDITGQKESKVATVNLEHIKLNCHFFLVDEIEFDLDPKEINSIQDYDILENFMIDVSESIGKQITLTDENNPEFPLVKIDTCKAINRVLTLEESRKYRRNPNVIKDKLNSIKTKIEMRFAPKRFKEGILKSASEIHKSTNRDKNVW